MMKIDARTLAKLEKLAKATCPRSHPDDGLPCDNAGDPNDCVDLNVHDCIQRPGCWEYGTHRAYAMREVLKAAGYREGENLDGVEWHTGWRRA